jgi:hypothetical protein
MLSAPVSAAQIAQQKIQEQGSQQLKQGASKFDGALAQKAQGAQGVQSAQAPNAAQSVSKASSVQATQAPAKIEHARATEQVSKSERASFKRVESSEPKPQLKATEEFGFKREAMGTNKGSGVMTRLIGDIERGQGVMDKLIQAGLSGKSFSNSELLALQAGMYKFTQELELTGKVVEKATTGLKDTLKTQV